MAAVYLWIEAVELEVTLYDTDDISTIRGGSMHLEELGECAAAYFCGTLLDHGASRALLKLGSDDRLDERIRTFLDIRPWRFFCLIWGTGPDPDAAQAAAKCQRVGIWTLPPPRPRIGAAPDPLDRLRPATEKETGPEGEERLLSPSTNARRLKGRNNRPWIFAGVDRVPPQSFAEIVDAPPDHVAAVVRDKLAVVVADGVGGGDFGKAFCSAMAKADPAPDDDALRQGYADALNALRGRLATRIEQWAIASGLGYTRHVPRLDSDFTSFRVDVLVWGGDDMTFVLPASHIFPFLEMFFDEVDKPFAAGVVDDGFPHRAGVIVAHYKTPIRLMRRLAKQSEALVKEWLAGRKQSAFAIDIYESSPLAHDGVAGYRRALYGPGFDAAAAAFSADDLPRLKRLFADAAIGGGTDAVLSTTQIHRVSQKLREARLDLVSTPADAMARQLLDRHLSARDGGAANWDDWTGAFSGVKRCLPVLLAEIAQLEPYVRAGWPEQVPDGQGRGGTDPAGDAP